MPSPRKYATDAERQAAHRARVEAETVRVSRAALEGLRAAIDAAAAAGVPDAEQVRTGSPDALLRNLALWWERRSQKPR